MDIIETGLRIGGSLFILLVGFAAIVELRHRRARRQWRAIVKTLERQAQAEIVRQQRDRFGLTDAQVEQFKRDMGYEI